MAKLTIDLSGTKGLAPRSFGDANDAAGQPRRRYLGQPGQMAQGTWNPFRALGYMAPPTSMSQSSLPITESDATYDFASEARAVLYDVTGTNGSNGKGVWLADASNVWYQNSGGPNGFVMANAQHLSANTPRITDLEMYQVNGVRKIFFSYQQATGAGGDIGIIAPNAGSTNPTWLSATVSGAFQTGATNNVVMVSADNGYLYVLDGSSLHKIDGTTAGGANGTAYPNALVFPPEMTLVDAVDWQAHLWIAVQSTSSYANNGTAYNERVVGIVSWDRKTTADSLQTFVPVPGLREIRKVYVTPQGELRVIGISSERLTQIRRYNGQTFEIVEELGIWSYPPYRDSVTYLGGLVAWLGYDGTVYGHGKLPALQSGSLYYTADQLFTLGSMRALPNADFTPGAILAYGAGNVGTFSGPPTSLPGIIFGYADSNGNRKAYQWPLSGTGTISGVNQQLDAGNAYTLVQRLPGLCSVNYVRVWCLPQGSAGTAARGTLSIYADQSAAPLPGGTVTITQNDVKAGFRFIPMGGAGLHSLQFEVSWPTNVLLSDSTDWLPYEIEVDYDELPKKK